MQKWILMKKGEEEKLVHPGNVNNHLRFGWVLADQTAVPAEVKPVTETSVTETEIVKDAKATKPKNKKDEGEPKVTKVTKNKKDEGTDVLSEIPVASAESDSEVSVTQEVTSPNTIPDDESKG